MNQVPSLRDFLEIPLALFNIIGVQIFEPDELHKKSVIKDLLSGILVINAIVQTLLEVIYLCVEPLPEAVSTMPLFSYTGYSVVSVLKLCVVFRARFLLQEIFAEMKKIHPSTVSEAVASRSAEYYARIRLCLRVVTVCYFFVTMMFDMFAMCQSIFEYLFYGGHFLRRLPYAMYYPFDPLGPGVFPFVYFSQLMCSVLSIFFSGPDFLLVSTVYLICMHFEYLSRRIADFIPKGTDEDVEELKNFLRTHQNLLDISYKVNMVFNLIILVNYLATGFLICIAAFLIATGVPTLDLLKFTAFLVSTGGHFYFVCHFGTKLLEMSADVSQAVFSHRWYLGNVRYRKMIPLFMKRAQKPAILTVFKFFVVTMGSFQNLMSTTYQVFTLLRTTLK